MRNTKVLPSELFSKRRHWFHISTTLQKESERLFPRDNDEGFNRSGREPNIKRICVSPTLEQCLTAVPYGKRDTIYIYRTRSKVKAIPPVGVFDSAITMEGWITRPTWFDRVGILNLEKIVDKKQKSIVMPEVASDGSLPLTKVLYRWWINLDPWKFVETS